MRKLRLTPNLTLHVTSIIVSALATYIHDSELQMSVVWFRVNH